MLEEIVRIFSYDSSRDFINIFKTIDVKSDDLTTYRHLGSFSSAPILGQFIKAEKIALGNNKVTLSLDLDI